MSKQGFEHLITGVTAKLPGDWAKHEAQFRPGSVSQVAALAEVQTPKRARGRVRHRAGQIRIVIPGPPPGKPRMTQRDKWAKRPEVVRYRDWCDLVRATAGKDVPDASLVRELNWTAYFEPPQSWSMKTRAAVIGTCHRQKPDRDNIDKAILDCLWPEGDSAIAAGTIRKVWDWNARLEIEIIVDTSQHGRLMAFEPRQVPKQTTAAVLRSCF